MATPAPRLAPAPALLDIDLDSVTFNISNDFKTTTVNLGTNGTKLNGYIIIIENSTIANLVGNDYISHIIPQDNTSSTITFNISIIELCRFQSFNITNMNGQDFTLKFKRIDSNFRETVYVKTPPNQFTFVPPPAAAPLPVVDLSLFDFTISSDMKNYTISLGDNNKTIFNGCEIMIQNDHTIFLRNPPINYIPLNNTSSTLNFPIYNIPANFNIESFNNTDFYLGIYPKYKPCERQYTLGPKRFTFITPRPAPRPAPSPSRASASQAPIPAPAESRSPSPAPVPRASLAPSPTKKSQPTVTISRTNPYKLISPTQFAVTLEYTKKNTDYRFLQVGVSNNKNAITKGSITKGVVINGRSSIVPNFNLIPINTIPVGSKISFTIGNLNRNIIYYAVFNTVDSINYLKNSSLQTNPLTIIFPNKKGGSKKRKSRKQRKTKKLA